jgi:hypothetical protein
METLQNFILDGDFWKIMAPIALGISVWYLNERSKRTQDEYKRKEERYSELLRTIRGFYVDSQDKSLKEDFLLQLNLCWLYAPDEIIQHAYNFLDKVRVGEKASDEEKEKAAGELFTAIRRDILKRKLLKETKLNSNDFRHLRAT